MAEFEFPHQTCLRESHEFLMHYMSTSLDDAMDHVYQSGHLTVAEKKQIDYGGPQEKTKKFLDILYYKDVKAFDVLLNALKKSSSHIYKVLERKLEEIRKNWKEDDRPRIQQQSNYTCILTEQVICSVTCHLILIMNH